MDLAAAGVGVMHGMQAIFFQDVVEVTDIGRQVLYIDCGVFDDGYGLLIAGQVAEESESGLAEVPDLFGVFAEQQREVVTQAGGAHIRLHFSCQFADLFPALFFELDDKDRSRVTLYEESVFSLFYIVLRALEDIVIDEFAGRRPIRQGQQVSPQ